MRYGVFILILLLSTTDAISEERMHFTNTYNPRVFSYTLKKEESAMFSLLLSSSPEGIREMFEIDAKLCAAARYNSFLLAKSGEVPAMMETTALRPLLWSYGIYDFLYLPVAFAYRSEDSLRDSIKWFITTITKREFFNCGLGVADFKDDKRIATIVCSKRVVESMDIPKIMNVGSRLRLDFKLRDGYREPLIYISPPSGGVKKVSPASLENGAFSYSYELSGGEGKYLVQIIAKGKGGVEPVFLVPVYAGVSPSEVKKEFSALINIKDNTKNVSPDIAREMLLKAINYERKKMNLSPLKRNPSLEKIAFNKAKAMAERQVFGHEVENLRLEEILRSNNIQFYKAAENIGLNSSPRMAHLLFMSSPAHRGNILEPIFTEVGIGVYKVGEENPQWYICEIFLMPKEL